MLARLNQSCWQQKGYELKYVHINMIYNRRLSKRVYRGSCKKKDRLTVFYLLFFQGRSLIPSDTKLPQTAAN
jgi:hypothetical protein